jgi:hypothetical protein
MAFLQGVSYRPLPVSKEKAGGAAERKPVPGSLTCEKSP